MAVEQSLVVRVQGPMPVRRVGMTPTVRLTLSGDYIDAWIVRHTALVCLNTMSGFAIY